jgi:integrase
LGDRPLQQLQSSEIDALYTRLADKLSPRTAHHVHVVLGACLGTATRTRKLPRNPMIELVKVPSPGEADHGMALEADQLRTLIQGFKGSALFAIVAVAAFTGARRNEILALRWEDLDAEKKTLRIERAIEETDEHGLRIKGPKTERGKRTITIDDDLLGLLIGAHHRHLRIVAGVPDGAPVDLSLVKLPAEALMFPNPPAGDESFSFTKLRNPRNRTKEFVRKATALGFAKLRLHDLRARMKRYCLTPAFRCMSSPHGVVTIRLYCCGPTPSGRGKRTYPQPMRSALYRKAPCTEIMLGPSWVHGSKSLLKCSLE